MIRISREATYRAAEPDTPHAVVTGQMLRACYTLDCRKMRIFLTSAMLIAALGSLSAQVPAEIEDQDAFGADIAAEPERGPAKIKFREGTEIEINDDRLVHVDLDQIKFDFDLSKLTEAESAGIQDRRAIRGFDRPKAMWRIDDGFLGAYNGGEFGGALFHFSKDGSQRTFIMGEHVNDVISVGESDYVIAGGLEHLDFGIGALIAVRQDKDGNWNSKVIARFFDGVAAIVGKMDGGTIVVSTWRTIPSGHCTPPDEGEEKTIAHIGAYFEVKKDGWMQYLGETVWPARVYSPKSNNNGSYHDGAGQPPTAPESE